jgi:hypothetical protein
MKKLILILILLIISNIGYAEKLFEFDSRIGSIKDNISGTIPTNNGVTIQVAQKGRSCYFDSDDLDSYGSIAGVKTIVFWIKHSGDTKLFQDNGADKLEISSGNITGTGLTQNYVNNVDTDAVENNNWQLIISEFSSGIDFSTDFEIDPTANIYISRVILFDEVISSTQRQKLYNEFRNSFNISKSIRNFRQDAYKINVDKETGLVAYYDFASLKQNRTVYDETNNNYNGTMTNVMISNDGAIFSGSNSSYITIQDGAIIDYTDYTIEFVLSISDLMTYDGVLFSNSNGSFNEIIDSIGIRNGAIGWNFNPSGTYRQGSTKTLPLNELVYIVFTSDGGRSGTIKIYINGEEDTITSTNFYRSGEDVRIGGRSNAIDETPFYGTIRDFAISNRTKSATEIKERWNKIARQPELVIDGQNWNATGETNTSGRVGDLDIQSGSFKVEEDNIGKYIENVSAGIISTPSKSGRRFKHKFYKGDTANVYDFFINTEKDGSGNGYLVRFGSDEKIYLYPVTSGSPGSAIITSSGTFDLNTWFEMDLQWEVNGDFDLLIDNTSVGTGNDTTYSSFKYVGIDSDSGDRSGIIEIDKGVSK